MRDTAVQQPRGKRRPGDYLITVLPRTSAPEPARRSKPGGIPGVSRVQDDHTLLFEVARAAHLLRSDFERRCIRIDGVGHGAG